MIVYLVEFALLHTLFYIVFKAFLSKETQLRFLRLFLISATILALVLPAIDIPSNAPIPTVKLDEIVLGASQNLQPVATNSQLSLPWYGWVLVTISGLLLLQLVIGLSKVIRWYRQSEPDNTYDSTVRKTSGMKNSFTFFRWIFIDLDHFEDPHEIIRHEQGHSKNLHSLDILFFHLVRVAFWWVPSVWLVIQELKKIHEFEADQFALKSTEQDEYIKTLVHSTLKAHGLNLASSFDDAPIVKRLNFIKKMKKKISPWKVGSIMAIVVISGAMFACEDELDSEIQRISEESSQQVIYSDEVAAALTNLQEQYPGKEFTVIETIGDNKESIEKLNQYDPNQIERLFVFKEDGDKRIVMIVDKSSELFNRSLEVQEREIESALVRIKGVDGTENPGEEIELIVETLDNSPIDKNTPMDNSAVFTIVEEPASFPGGMEPFKQYLNENIKYPQEAKEKGLQGRVFVQFIVETDGSLSDFKILKGIHPDCDQEALRVMQNSPQWIAGKQRGKAIRQKMIQSISFVIP